MKTNGDFVPVVVDNDIDIVFQNTYDKTIEFLFLNIDLKYEDKPIEVISHGEWVDRFVNEQMNHIICASRFQKFIVALTEFIEYDDSVTTHELFAAISCMQISAEIIYE